jgi:hypothetical protein
MINNSFSALALETFIPNSFNLTYDCFIGPCQGFKHIGVVHNYNFVENSTIILYSNNVTQINWARLLVKEWSGNLYQLWPLIRDFANDVNAHVSFPPIMDNLQINSVYLDQIYSEYGLDMDLLMEQWQRMKKFNWIFLEDTANLADLVNKTSNHSVYVYNDQNQFDIVAINEPTVIETKNSISLQKSGA